MTHSRSGLRLLTAGMLVVVLTLAMAGPAAARARIMPGVDGVFSAEPDDAEFPTAYLWHVTGVSWYGYQKVTAVELAAEWTCMTESLSGSAQLDVYLVEGRAPAAPQNITLETNSWTTLSENGKCTTRIVINLYGGGSKLLWKGIFATYDGRYVS